MRVGKLLVVAVLLLIVVAQIQMHERLMKTEHDLFKHIERTENLLGEINEAVTNKKP